MNYSIYNCLPLGAGGLNTPNNQPQCKPVLDFLASATINYSGNGSKCNPLGLEVKLSEKEGNIITIENDGLYAYSSGDSNPVPLFTPKSVPFAGADGKLTEYTSFVWDNINKRLGIGTASPAYTLDVAGQIRQHGNADMVFTRSENYSMHGITMLNAAGNNEIAFFKANGGNGEVRFGSGSGGYYTTIFSNGSERIRINTSGYVGINNNNPSFALDVTGQIRQVSNNDLIIGRSTENVMIGLSLHGLGGERGFFKLNSASGEIRMGAAGGGYYYTIYSNGVESMRFDTNGRVSIGGFAPSAYLHLPASNTAFASLRIPTGVAPTLPNNGDIWSDGSNLYLRQNSISKKFLFNAYGIKDIFKVGDTGKPAIGSFIYTNAGLIGKTKLDCNLEIQGICLPYNDAAQRSFTLDAEPSVTGTMTLNAQFDTNENVRVYW